MTDGFVSASVSNHSPAICFVKRPKTLKLLGTRWPMFGHNAANSHKSISLDPLVQTIPWGKIIAYSEWQWSNTHLNCQGVERTTSVHFVLCNILWMYKTFLYYIVLHYITLYCVVSCHIIYHILYCIIFIILYHIILYYTTLQHITSYYITYPFPWHHF